MPFACSKKSRSHLQWKNTHNEKKSSLPSLSSHNLCQQNIIYGLVTEIMSRRNSPGLKKASISLSGLLWIRHSEQALLYITNLQASLALKNASKSKAGFVFLQYGQGKCHLLDGKNKNAISDVKVIPFPLRKWWWHLAWWDAEVWDHEGIIGAAVNRKILLLASLYPSSFGRACWPG